MRNRLRASGVAVPGFRGVCLAPAHGTPRDRPGSMDTPRTDRDRAERLAATIYHGADLHLWSPTDEALHYVLAYLVPGGGHDTIGSGTTPEAAWRQAHRVLRARAVALGDALAAELGAP